MAEMLDLLCLLQEAEGPSRKLDALIEVKFFEIDSSEWPEDLVTARLPYQWDNCADGTYWRCSRSGNSLHAAWAYTDNIDCATALVERVLPEWFWTASSDGEASVWQPSPTGTKRYSAVANEPALALCTALADAMLSEGEKETS